MSKTSRLFFAAAAGLASASVFAGLLYEPGNYAAQDNLILHLDGIRNVGELKAHDADATAWVDLAAGNTATFGAILGRNVTSEWTTDGYTFGNGAYGELANTINVGNAFTIQFVCDVDLSEQTSSYPTVFGAAGDLLNFYGYKGQTRFMFNTKGISGSVNAQLSNWEGRYMTALYDKKGKASFQTATGSVTAGSDTTSVGAQKLYIGDVLNPSDGNPTGYATARYLDGTLKAIRIYNKVLSTDELAANRALDEVRFFGELPVTNVVVATAVDGLEGCEGSGAYAIDADGYTFTAPQKATKDGAVYACTGYTLETWDGAQWSAPMLTAATTYAATDTSAKVRITWQWQYAHGEVTTDLDPLFGNYVTDGLVLHLDGIRNVGATLPHDYTSGRWVDLAGGKTADFHHDFPDASVWRDDGYYFGGRSYAEFATQLTGLTNTVTVQVVCDTTTNALVALKAGYADYALNWPQPFGCNDNDSLNLYYDLNNGNHQMTFKNASGGNVNIPKFQWEGRYATAIRNGKDKYILQTTSLASAAHVNGTQNDIGSLSVRVGSAGSTIGKRRQRWFLGTVKAIRVYNRVLSDAELAQNRQVDEVRFFGAAMPVTNVVVASTVRGLSGDTPEGAYALSSGGHTFTAPASVSVGDDVYSCAGYTLETWDGSAWGAPVANAGLSCTLSDTSAKVRLTWQWTHTAGPGYDAAFNDYVTDGLVLHLDGIRNAGLQAAHDDGALSWTDLATKGGAGRLVVSGESGWKSDGYYFDGKSQASYAVMNGSRTLDASYTVQEVFDFDADASHRITTAWPALLGTTDGNDAFAVYYNQNNIVNPTVMSKVLNTSTGINVYNWDGEYMNVQFDGSQIAMFTEATPSTWNAFSKKPGTRTFTFGAGEGGGGGFAIRRLAGTVKAVRFYDRVLTAAELEQNRAVDEVRFFGRAPAASGMLVVASTVDGLGGDLPCGVYSPAAGYTFTSQTAAALDGTPYELKGYTLESWDGSAWGSATEGTGASVAPDVSSASRRLTWNWAVKSRCTKLPDYDVGDYVQDGLYLHFDGIRNVGADAEHCDSTNVWVNLGTGGSALNASFDYASDVAAGDGWAADGYNFVYGGKFAKLADNPNFGCYATIQAVAEVGAGTAAYPTIFGSTDDFLNVYDFTAGTQLFLKVFNNRSEVKSGNTVTTAAGGRQQMAGAWQGEYATAIWHAGKYQIFQETVPTPANWAGKWRYNWSTWKDMPFFIGGVYKDDETFVNDRRLTGKIQALRVYTRSLSDEELEHNRLVDDARFKGILPDWNVEIAQGKFDSDSVGHYLVEGTYTFTEGPATDTVMNKTRNVVGYTVETWDEVNQVWTNAAKYDGDSYTYSGTDKVRLTWKWQPDGTILIVR